MPDINFTKYAASLWIKRLLPWKFLCSAQQYFSGLFFLRSIFLYIQWNYFVILKVVTLKTIKDLRTIFEWYLATIKKIWLLYFKTEITKFYKSFYPECRQKLETFNGSNSSSIRFTYISANLRDSLYFVLFIFSWILLRLRFEYFCFCTKITVSGKIYCYLRVALCVKILGRHHIFLPNVHQFLPYRFHDQKIQGPFIFHLLRDNKNCSNVFKSWDNRKENDVTLSEQSFLEMSYKPFACVCFPRMLFVTARTQCGDLKAPTLLVAELCNTKRVALPRTKI
jgi:hypothetical protein